MSIFSSIFGSNPTPQDLARQKDERMFRNSTDQLPPEALGFDSIDNNTVSPQSPPSKQQKQQPQSHNNNNNTNTTTTKSGTEQHRRLHYDGIMESETLEYDLAKGPRPSLVQPHETRTNLDFHGYFSTVLHAFKTTYPQTFLPELNFNVAPLVGEPFNCQPARLDCAITPLALATSEPLLRKVFRILTPTYHEDSVKLFSVTDSLFFSPNRCKFLLSKAMCEASLGVSTPLTLLKLKFLERFFVDKYHAARLTKEFRSDGMAAKTQLPIALGGIEHMTKLNHFYTLYKEDIPITNDAVYSAERFMNLLTLIQDQYNLAPIDAIQQALPPSAFITKDPSNVINSAAHILDLHNEKQRHELEREANQKRDERGLLETLSITKGASI